MEPGPRGQMVPLVERALRVRPDQPVELAQRVSQDRLAQQAQQAQRVQPETPVPRGQQEPRVLPVWARLDRPELLVRRVRRGLPVRVFLTKGQLQQPHLCRDTQTLILGQLVMLMLLWIISIFGSGMAQVG